MQPFGYSDTTSDYGLNSQVQWTGNLSAESMLNTQIRFNRNTSDIVCYFATVPNIVGRLRDSEYLDQSARCWCPTQISSSGKQFVARVENFRRTSIQASFAPHSHDKNFESSPVRAGRFRDLRKGTVPIWLQISMMKISAGRYKGQLNLIDHLGKIRVPVALLPELIGQTGN